ncbi:Dna binding response regulator PrrA (RegA) [hydrothermal vent metagenome]|uniref:Dna binding response regulator PrrA (RegA) n=1 Tax=hydrothermal vent metagenome TaxID=652676 RepID=A0A3B1BJV5_9ZZZZ
MKSNDQVPKHPARLIVVDDDETFAQVLSNALAKQGYDTVHALNCSQALVLAQQTPPDYAIVDLRIGQESGLSLIQQLRVLNGDIHILILTGYASIATAVEAIKLGADHYLTKPADTREIIKALQKQEADPGVEAPAHPLSVKRLEWEHLQKVLLDHDGNISAAARALGMHRRSLQRKLAKKPSRE